MLELYSICNSFVFIDCNLRQLCSLKYCHGNFDSEGKSFNLNEVVESAVDELPTRQSEIKYFVSIMMTNVVMDEDMNEWCMSLSWDDKYRRSIRMFCQ